MFWLYGKKKKETEDDKVWKLCSKYIRFRDWLRTMWMLDVGKCISCNKIIPTKWNDAGHYISRADKKLKYNHKNIHLQCGSCNRYKDGEKDLYRNAIIRLYGEEFVECLQRTNEIYKVYRDYEAEKAYYKYLIKAIKTLPKKMTQQELKEFVTEKHLAGELENYLLNL